MFFFEFFFEKINEKFSKYLNSCLFDKILNNKIDIEIENIFDLNYKIFLEKIEDLEKDLNFVYENKFNEKNDLITEIKKNFKFIIIKKNSLDSSQLKTDENSGNYFFYVRNENK